MQKFLIVNTKGFSLEQAILAMHQNLQQLHEKEETSMLEIHSVNFVNTFEKPQKTALDISPGANQPVIVYNCCVVLVEPKPKPDIDKMVKTFLEDVKKFAYGDDESYRNPTKPPDLSKYGLFPLNQEGDTVVNIPADQPTDKEVTDLKAAAAFMKRSEQFNCAHEHLDPVKRNKGHRGDQYFQICEDCGSEVWHGIDDQHPAPGSGYVRPDDPMFIVPGGEKKEDSDRARGQDI